MEFKGSFQNSVKKKDAPELGRFVKSPRENKVKISRWTGSRYRLTRSRFKNKVKIYNKPMILDDTTYILATPWKEYIVFLKGIHKDKILDLRYMV